MTDNKTRISLQAAFPLDFFVSLVFLFLFLLCSILFIYVIIFSDCCCFFKYILHLIRFASLLLWMQLHLFIYQLLWQMHSLSEAVRLLSLLSIDILLVLTSIINCIFICQSVYTNTRTPLPLPMSISLIVFSFSFVVIGSTSSTCVSICVCAWVTTSKLCDL